jgi:hypothetical protein
MFNSLLWSSQAGRGFGYVRTFASQSPPGRSLLILIAPANVQEVLFEEIGNGATCRSVSIR